MARSAPNNLRVIAEREIDCCFHGLDPVTRNDLATSLVRQWVTNGGKAVLVTRGRNFWFEMTRLDSGETRVVRDVKRGDFADHMRRSRVPEEEIPYLLHDLNVRQSVRCYTDYGEPLQLRVEPASRTFHIELVRVKGGPYEGEESDC